jgi:hypothetical protein
VLVEQPGGVVPFTATRAMVLGVAAAPPQKGTIDLKGLPW